MNLIPMKLKFDVSFHLPNVMDRSGGGAWPDKVQWQW